MNVNNIIHNTEYASLFQELLDKDFTLRFKVTGESMKPFLKGNEIVTVRKVYFKKINIGDLILFIDNNDLHVIHRVISKKNNHNGEIIFITKGDRLFSTDEPITEDNVLGKIIRIEKISSDKFIKSINLESPLWKLLNYLKALFNVLKISLH